jgi:hypothetical protein
VLIALREDYLAPLEGLKAAMPSITQNRLRLAPMTGQQALAAVIGPGKGLVSEEVAAAIVRFVAGGAEIANAEVEPSLLSLICRELNDARIAQGRSEISLDLLAGSHASILSNFYERSLADQPPAVRHIIEDELADRVGLSRKRRRRAHAQQFRCRRRRARTLAVLVNRRLLRIEERLDVRRVELTHDVLCSVVAAAAICAMNASHAMPPNGCSPNSASASSRRAVRWCARAGRTRHAPCWPSAHSPLPPLAYLSTERARRAEHQAQETRAIAAEQGRAQAEHLLGYLTDDFTRELETFRPSRSGGGVRQAADRLLSAPLPPALKDI